MSVYLVIRQDEAAPVSVSMNRVIQWSGLSSGVVNINGILEDEISDETIVLYDSDRIGRGFDCTIEGNNIVLHLPIPATPHDIDLFYRTAAVLCRHVKVQKAYPDDGDEESAVPVSRFAELAEEAGNASAGALRMIQSKANSEPDSRYMITAALHPVSFGVKQTEAVNGNLEQFEEYLHTLQSGDVYYADCLYLRRKADDTVFGVYCIGDDIPCAVQKVPSEIFAHNIAHEKIEQWYVMLPPDNMIPYRYFIDNVEILGEYDAERVIVHMDEHRINEISRKGTVDIETNEPVPFHPYHRA